MYFKKPLSRTAPHFTGRTFLVHAGSNSQQTDSEPNYFYYSVCVGLIFYINHLAEHHIFIYLLILFIYIYLFCCEWTDVVVADQ